MTLTKTEYRAILLTSVLKFKEQIKTLVRDETSPIIVVTGPAGAGKSIAVQYALDNMPQPENTSLPELVRIFSPPKSSPQSLISTIAKALEEKQGGNAEAGMVQYTATILGRNQVRYLIIDDADRLSIRCFKFLSRIQEQWSGSFILVGLPELSSKFKLVDFLHKPIAREILFLPPTTESILNEFLPRYWLENWHFDPADSVDRQLGQHLWQQVRPNLHNLETALQLVSAMAALEGTQITREVVDECLALMGLQ